MLTALEGMAMIFGQREVAIFLVSFLFAGLVVAWRDGRK